MSERSVMLKLVAERESGAAFLFRSADDPKVPARWCPKRWILDMTEDYTVGTGEILDVELPEWKAVECGWFEP